MFYAPTKSTTFQQKRRLFSTVEEKFPHTYAGGATQRID